MNNLYLILVITLALLCAVNSQKANAQTCENENSTHTLGMVSYFLSDPRFEPDRIESGIQNLNIDDLTMLESFQHSELCNQLKQTTAFVNAPPSGNNDISFFKSSERKFIVYFFLDTLPADDGLTFYSGPKGLIRIFDNDLEHILSVSIR